MATRSNRRAGIPLPVGALLTAALFVVSGQATVAARSFGALPGAVVPATKQPLPPIQHVVVVTLENHAFDNYFGTYCPHTGPNCPQSVFGYPAGLCLPLNPNKTNSPCLAPFPFTPANWTVLSLMPHTNASSLQAWDNGRMDDFYRAEHSGFDPFGYYNGSTAPLYWDLAEEYGLSDAFFSSTLSYSLPNHWFALAGQAPAASFWGTNLSTNGYIGQANGTTTVEDLLVAHPNVTWKYYDYALASWTRSQQITGHFQFGAFDYWNPLAAKFESYSTQLSPHFVSNTRFYKDAAAGKLPQISWVVPFSQESDHPPGNVTRAESWLASVVDAVEASPNWNSTALFITWDDYGGFYDGVTPPYLGGVPLSFRVPLIVISPFTSVGLVDHTTLYFESLLHFIENRFGLGCITTRDCQAPLPNAFFNFTQPHRAPINFPTTLGNWTYPYAPTPSAPGPDAYVPPSTFTANASGDGVDVD